MSYDAASAGAFGLWLTAGCSRLAAVITGLAADRSASTAVEYAMILGGIALSTLGVTLSTGVEINEVFESIHAGLNYGSCIVCAPE